MPRKRKLIHVTDYCFIVVRDNGSIQIGDDTSMDGIDRPATLQPTEIPKLLEQLENIYMGKVGRG